MFLLLEAVQTIGWGLIEMSACFIGVLIMVAKIAGMSGDQSMSAFTKGLQIMIVPALVVGVTRQPVIPIRSGAPIIVPANIGEICLPEHH
jgi:uncharacterized ion transporter superfamily protein YfcC